MINHEAAVAAIVRVHRDRLGLPARSVAAPEDSAEPPVYRAARAACLQLGFIAADAECLARAWERMSARTGHFDPQAWPDQPTDCGLAPWPRPAAFARCGEPRELGLYAVLPSAAWVARMADAGVPTLQLRFKSVDAQAVRREIGAAVRAVRGTGSRLFINDHWQEALAGGAYGVHLGQEDLDTADLAAIRAAGLRVGMSTHGYAEMLRVDALAPSYIAMGAVFPTTLKAMPTAPQGPGRLGAYAALLRDYPLVAIGGIDAGRIAAVMASGVGSVAVVRAIVAAEDPEAAVAQLQGLMRAR